MTGSYNNFFRVFDRSTKRDLTLEAARDIAKPKTLLKPRKVSITDFFLNPRVWIVRLFGRENALIDFPFFFSSEVR